MADETHNTPDSHDSPRPPTVPGAEPESQENDREPTTAAAAESDEGAPDPVPGAQTIDLPSFESNGSTNGHGGRIGFLGDVNLNVKIELGRTRMYVEDVLMLNEGSVVELDKPAGDPVDIFVNDRHVARGEVLVVNDNFCVRISEIIQRADDDEDGAGEGA